MPKLKAWLPDVLLIAGTPAVEDMVFFRIGRKIADAADTMAINAHLHAVVGAGLELTTSAG